MLDRVSSKPKPVRNSSPKKVKVTPWVVARDKLHANLLKQRERRQAGQTDLFKPAVNLFPPEVGPAIKEGMPKLAMDDNMSSTLSWAQNAIQSTFAEGLTFLGYAFLAQLAQRPEYRRAAEILAEEMTRKWIKLQSVSDDIDKTDRIKILNDAIDKFKIKDHFRKLAEQDNYFGRAHLYVDIEGAKEDHEEMKTSIGTGRDDTSKLKVGKGSLLGFKCVEAVWCYPTTYDSYDPLAGDWYNPTLWYVMARPIHATRLLKFVCREVPDLLKPAYAFGGLSLSQMGKPYVDNWLRTRQSIADFIHSFSVFVLKTNLSSSLQDGGEEFFERLNLFVSNRDNQGVMAIDNDTEDFGNVSASIAGLEGLQAQTQEHLCVSKGTLIETDRGQVPIEKVTLNDRVRTRAGLAPLKWVGITGRTSAFVKIKAGSSTLRITEDHPIWSESTREFVSAKNVERSHHLLKSRAWENMGNLWLGEAYFGAKQNSVITEIIEKAAAFCTERFTKFTLALFQRVMRFTILMKTNLTIVFQTLGSSPVLNIGPYTRLTDATDLIDTVNIMPSSVLGARLSLGQPYPSEFSIAQTSAKIKHIERPIPIEDCPTSIEKKQTVRCFRREVVYNLSVADGFPPEFFANGILVHNCAVWGIPAIKYLNIQPAGFNASSEGEIRTFYDTILALQERFFRPNLTRVLDFIMLHLWGEVDQEITFAFEPLWSLDEERMSAKRKTDMDTDVAGIDAGILDPAESRKRVAADANSPYSSIDVDDLPKPPVEEGMGGGMEGEGGEETENSASSSSERRDRGGVPQEANEPSRRNE